MSLGECLADWQKNAKPSKWHTYYTGRLAEDVEELRKAADPRSREIDAVGKAAYALYRSGWYELAVRRSCIEPTSFEYLILKRCQRDDEPRPGIVHDIRYWKTSKPKKEDDHA